MEKFALLDFLKAFETLSAKSGAKPDAGEREENPPPAAENTPPNPIVDTNFNAMASVLARHEQISNKLKNKK